MGDRRPLAQEPDPARVPGVSSREPNMTLSPYFALQYDLGESYKKYLGYADIIARGGSLAPQISDLIFYSEVERTVARLFGQPRPSMVECTIHRPIEWTDVLLQSLRPGDFRRQESGMYRCRVRGVLIEVSEANYIGILNGVTARLLQPLHNLSDEQKEAQVRLMLSSNLRQTHQNLLEFTREVEASIFALDGTRPTHASIHPVDPTSTGRNEVQLPIPISTQRAGTAREMIYTSRTERDNDEVLQCNSIDSWSSAGSGSSAGYAISSSHTPPSNSNDAGNDTSDDANLIASGILLANLAHEATLNAELIDRSIPSAMKNHVAENPDLNSNANAGPSGLTFDMTFRSIPQWLLSITTPDNPGTPGNADDDAPSTGSDIPYEAKPKQAPRSTDTAAETQGISSHDSKKHRTESVLSESGNRHC